MEYLLLLGASLAYVWAFWALYVLSMGLYRAYLLKRLIGFTKVLAYPIVVFAGAVDVVANLTLANILFLDLPHELLVTTRLKRYKAGDITGWRYALANYICENMLDVFDPSGDHC